MTSPLKQQLLRKFSSEPDKYYAVELFRREGFVRKKCKKCGRYFWTLDPDREVCPNQPCQEYEFIGKPPTPKRFSYTEAWKTIERFFVKEGHTSIPRYPVVARWRPDLYFTVASIIDFQRVEGDRVVFELPANPLIVPQACLRFNDIQNVGFSGRHYTEFVMIGQHALNNEEGYWKDRTIELDFRLLVEEFGISKEEIVFVEDVWVGYGAFGYSLEYFVRGLELGNAVFTEFEGTPENYKIMKPQVVDMGAGLERFVWLSNGTPTSYDSVFANELDKLRRKLGIGYDEQTSRNYYRVAGKYDLSEIRGSTDAIINSVLREAGVTKTEYEEYIKPLTDLYIVLDHVRALVFAVADGALPSNVGGGYNLRVILRRAQSVVDNNRWPITLVDVAELVARNLKAIFPELIEALPAIQEIFEVEIKRYRTSLDRINKLLRKLLVSKKGISTEELLTLYESHGVTPELLAQTGVIAAIPADFYSRLTEKHERKREPRGAEKEIRDNVSNLLSGLPPTRKLYYEDRYLTKCRAKVLRVLPSFNAVVLDQTIFYPRGGGQEPDKGTINDSLVVNVEKAGDIVVHYIRGRLPQEGDIVVCALDEKRRAAIMRHHSATHILNGAARAVLGPWVWQHSAFKEEDRARLDITHHSALTQEQIEAIEALANNVIQRNIPVEIQILPRRTAEKLYGFRLYQGGAIPEKTLRIVKIGDFDVEACGGTHVSATGEVGLIKILKAERVQDGVVRIEFVAGPAALKYLQEQARRISAIASRLNTPQDRIEKKIIEVLDELDRREKTARRLIDIVAEEFLSKPPYCTLKGSTQVYILSVSDLPREVIVGIGDRVIHKKPSGSTIFIGFLTDKAASKTQIIVMSSSEAVKENYGAGTLVRRILEELGGKGGGKERVGMGAVPRPLGDREIRALLERSLGCSKS